MLAFDTIKKLMELSEEFWVGVVETLGAQQRFERIIIAVPSCAAFFCDAGGFRLRWQ